MSKTLELWSSFSDVAAATMKSVQAIFNLSMTMIQQMIPEQAPPTI